MANRIYFKTRYRGIRFYYLLDSFLKVNPQYKAVDTGGVFGFTDSCSCDCLTLSNKIYFGSPPKEAYVLTYDYDTMYAEGAGVIDIVFVRKGDKWVCVKSSKFDGVEKARIKTRLDTAIIDKLR